MAMLAEPRQKKRYNLTPRGKPLYEDDTRYGTKMLEKWGWAKGKGLGANLHGSKDFVRVHLRNSNEGLGYEDRDDHWTQHEQDFTGLLKTLNGGNDDESNGGAKENTKENGSEYDEAPRIGFGYTTETIKPKVVKLKDKISGVSLEEKSKTSKARVHYRKFTKGKDIAQYSEKDLANIFGKKVVETEQANGVYEALTSLTWPQAEKEEDIKSTDNEEEKLVKSNFAGVQTVSTGLSVSDYFKQKMEAMKNRQKQQQNASFEQAAEEVEAVEAKKKIKKRKRQEVAEEIEPETVNQESSTFVEATSAGFACVSKNEKKKKRKAIASVDPSQEEHVEEPKKKKKKSKKRENEDSIDMDAIDQAQVNLDGDEQPKKAKKSKRNKDQKSEAITNKCVIASAYQVEEISDVQKPTKAKKSKRTERVQLSEEAESPTTNNEVLAPQTLKTKKKRKDKKSSSDEANLMLQNDAASLDDAVGKKKKKSKNKDNLETKTEQYLPQTEETINDTPSTKKQINSKAEVSDDTAKSIQSLTLDELIAQYNSYNVYNISSFSAEKFRNADLERFNGANLSHLPGYSHDGKDLKLNIKYFPGDEKRITALWNCTINKYNLANPKAIFHTYRCNMMNAYREKQKHLPRLHMKTFKRKSIFQSI